MLGDPLMQGPETVDLSFVNIYYIMPNHKSDLQVNMLFASVVQAAENVVAALLDNVT